MQITVDKHLVPCIAAKVEVLSDNSKTFYPITHLQQSIPITQLVHKKQMNKEIELFTAKANKGTKPRNNFKTKICNKCGDFKDSCQASYKTTNVYICLQMTSSCFVFLFKA